MATPCNKLCDDTCLRDRKSVYICLKSEGEFLSSLLRLGGDAESKRNLLGYEPSELIDWYLYAKRSFLTWPSKDPFGWSIKLLDELGKVLFGLTQVTAKAPQNYPNPTMRGKLLLLRPLEQDLVKAFLPSGFLEMQLGPSVLFRNDENIDYQQVHANALNVCHSAGMQLRNGQSIEEWRIRYESEIECRVAYTNIEQVGAFYWDEYKSLVLLIYDERNDPDRISRLKLACAYLHGVAKFALPKDTKKADGKNAADSSRLGYWIDECTAFDGEAHSLVLSEGKPKSQTFALIPNPSSPDVRLSCELAASLVEEYWGFFDPEQEPNQAPFNIMFMCKEQAGWFWCLTEYQLQYLTQKSQGNDVQQYARALERFRFSRAGIINHLDRTEGLVGEVCNFQDEKFICVTVGYHLEETSDEVDNFKRFEESLPNVNESSYFYFRITPHVPSPDVANKKILPIGALVAVFRFDRNREAGSIIKRLKQMAVIRHLVERWRAKVDSLKTVPRTVRELARPAQEKTARAAIMSRNLSHNVGSHALANPKLFEAIGVLNQIGNAPLGDREFAPLIFPHAKPFRDKPQDEATLPLCVLCHKEVSSLGPIKRNKDGNVKYEPETDGGGNVVGIMKSNAPVLEGEAWRARNRLGALNSYLQARMDFIARALGDATSQPEPMFFVNDLLKGFLGQTALLNTLLSDNGYTADQLDFTVSVELNTRSAITFHGKSTDHEMRHTNFESKNGNFNDLLVAVPGGMVGRHALYAFLENFLRNAAKYGAKSKAQAGIVAKERLEIYLRLREAEAICGIPSLSVLGGGPQMAKCYVLTVHDNISFDSQEFAIDRVREHLNEPIIDTEGKAQLEGHGIQEMKVCASFLAGGDGEGLVFPKDADTNDLKRCQGTYYETYAVNAKVKIDAWNSLVCHPQPLAEKSKAPDNTAQVLAYSLLLHQPRLLGIVDCNNSDFAEQVRPASKEPTVVFYNALETLSKHPAYFGVIKLHDELELDKILEDIKSLHTALPYRLMLAIDGGSAELKRKAEDLQNRIKNMEGIFNDGSILPVRRVRVIACPTLYKVSKDSSSQELHELTLRIYDLWLDAFKGKYKGSEADKWHLAIAFERGRDYVLEKWNLSSNGNTDLGFDPKSTQLRLSLKFAPEAGEAAAPNSLTSNENQPVFLDFAKVDRKLLLALDNHGNCISGEQEKEFGQSDAIAVYHPFSGAQQIDLFQLLDAPPKDRFARSFLIYAIAEALLTNVVVVDERVADACLLDNPPQPFGPRMREKQRSRIFPVYDVSAKRVRHPLSDTARKAVDQSLKNETDIEGLILPQEGRPYIRSYSRIEGNLTPFLLNRDTNPPDVIVIHEGVTDTMHAHDPSLWQEGDHRPLYWICPCVVRTSGRGSESRYLGNELPFYEFSELSDAVYRQMNKVALVRGLFSLRAEVRKKKTEK